jgi:hypothetical protein
VAVLLCNWASFIGILSIGEKSVKSRASTGVCGLAGVLVVLERKTGTRGIGTTAICFFVSGRRWVFHTDHVTTSLQPQMKK